MLAYRALLHPLYVSLFFYYLFIVNQVRFQYHLSISLTFSLNWLILINCCYLFAYNFIIRQCFHSVLPLWDQGGMIFVSSARQGGATANLQEPEWGHIQGGRWFEVVKQGGTTLSWWIVGISTKCFALNFTNFPCGAILCFIRLLDFL